MLSCKTLRWEPIGFSRQTMWQYKNLLLRACPRVKSRRYGTISVAAPSVSNSRAPSVLWTMFFALLFVLPLYCIAGIIIGQSCLCAERGLDNHYSTTVSRSLECFPDCNNKKPCMHNHMHTGQVSQLVIIFSKRFRLPSQSSSWQVAVWLMASLWVHRSPLPLLAVGYHSPILIPSRWDGCAPITLSVLCKVYFHLII